MAGFLDDPMGGTLEDTDEEHLRLFMRAAETKYFPKSKRVQDLTVLDSLDPGALRGDYIEISRNVIRAKKLCKVIILHELIHRWLIYRDGDADKDEGPRFQKEVDRLWSEGAYRKLL